MVFGTGFFLIGLPLGRSPGPNGACRTSTPVPKTALIGLLLRESPAEFEARLLGTPGRSCYRT